MDETRCCEFCRDILEAFAQDGVACGACENTRLLGIHECFCNAYEPSECGCEADWTDYIELEYWEEE